MSRLDPECECTCRLHRCRLEDPRPCLTGSGAGWPAILTWTVRVNSKTLSEHKGKTVRLTAKVVKIVGDVATVEACDGGEVSPRRAERN